MSVDVATSGPGRAEAFTGRTAWARNLGAPVRDFLNTETGSAVFLLAATIAALVWANSPWSDSYQSFWTTKLSIQIGGGGISTDLRHWVNEGLMTFFFLVIGLEAKRELDVGQLRERRRLAVPLFAAIGGMALPILIYLAVNAGGSGSHGWGTAMSTDTAFALGVLALVAPGGTRLRIRLLTVAVFDDLVALPVVALANAGIHFHGGLLGDAASSPITLGIFFGYVVGKPVGIFGAAWFVTRQRIGRGLRPTLSWPEIAGAGAVGGIGFTVSLLIASLAFHGRELDEAKIGVLVAGVVSSLVGWAPFRAIEHPPASMRAPQLLGTADELLHRSGDVHPERDHIRGPNDAPVTLVEY